jgi:hypothetical protein
VLFWGIYCLPFVTVVLRLGPDTIPDYGVNPVGVSLAATRPGG